MIFSSNLKTKSNKETNVSRPEISRELLPNFLPSSVNWKVLNGLDKWSNYPKIDSKPSLSNVTLTKGYVT
jgi:hypothetical protein